VEKDGSISKEEKITAVKNTLDRIRVIVVTIQGAEHLNPVIDLFADLGMLEMHRYMQKDYKADLVYMGPFKDRLVGLLRASTTNLGDLNGDKLEGFLAELFLGTQELVIKAIDWKIWGDFKKAQDVILQSV
jgi:hypothetical protein